MSVESPCVRNCCLNNHDICLGCGRSMKEIMEWGSALADRRMKIIDSAGKRRRQGLAETFTILDKNSH